MSQTSNTQWLHEAFIKVQQTLALQLELAAGSITHPGAQGDVSEDHWLEVFRAYLPNRYEVAKGFVIDSRGAKSEQIDLIVFDRHFTPTLLDQQRHRYIPVEAVYAVFEAKPAMDKAQIEYAAQKAASVRRLHRTSVPIAHAGGTYAAKQPFPIVGGFLARRVIWQDGLGERFVRYLPDDPQARLNCGCTLENGAFDDYDGELKQHPQASALVWFLFRLLGKLQSLGSVPAIDWSAYAAILNPPQG